MVAAKVKQLSYYNRLNKDFQSDLIWWHYFLEGWNGLGLMHLANEAIPTHLCIQTDGSGSWVCGGVWGSQWFQWQSDTWKETNIMAKELAAMVISCVVWGPELAKQRILV